MTVLKTVMDEFARNPRVGLTVVMLRLQRKISSLHVRTDLDSNTKLFGFAALENNLSFMLASSNCKIKVCTGYCFKHRMGPMCNNMLGHPSQYCD